MESGYGDAMKPQQQAILQVPDFRFTLFRGLQSSSLACGCSGLTVAPHCRGLVQSCVHPGCREDVVAEALRILGAIQSPAPIAGVRSLGAAKIAAIPNARK